VSVTHIQLLSASIISHVALFLLTLSRNVYGVKIGIACACAPYMVVLLLCTWRIYVYYCYNDCRQLALSLCTFAAANSVYMYDAPPPYPGIDPNLASYPAPPQVNGHHPAAAATAPYPDGPQSSAAGLLFCDYLQQGMLITSTKDTMDPEGARLLTYSAICLR